eukprot:SAG25_NODE_107_length_15283_cov_3.516728_8_plen_70_part_00
MIYVFTCPQSAQRLVGVPERIEVEEVDQQQRPEQQRTVQRRGPPVRQHARRPSHRVRVEVLGLIIIRTG